MKYIERNSNGAIVGAWSALAYPQRAAVPDNNNGLLAYLCTTAIGRKLADLDITIDDTAVAPCAHVLVGSRGAALQGSPLSGGYAGARRMLWLMAGNANGVAEQKGAGRPLPGDRASADDRRHRGRQRGGQRLHPGEERHAELVALAGELRPELHRYCARLMGSVTDGEDVVQDNFARALVTLDELQEAL